MRQRWLSVLLVLFLLCGQSTVAVHALGHLQASQQGVPCAVPADLEACGSAHDVCPKCLALAALAVAAPTVACLLPAACARRWHFPLGVSYHVALTSAPAARSRGPPLPIGMFR
jgi:hypothetical protein